MYLQINMTQIWYWNLFVAVFTIPMDWIPSLLKSTTAFAEAKYDPAQTIWFVSFHFNMKYLITSAPWGRTSSSVSCSSQAESYGSYVFIILRCNIIPQWLHTEFWISQPKSCFYLSKCTKGYHGWSRNLLIHTKSIFIHRHIKYGKEKNIFLCLLKFDTKSYTRIQRHSYDYLWSVSSLEC